MVRISRSLIMYGYIAGGPQKEPVFYSVLGTSGKDPDGICGQQIAGTARAGFNWWEAWGEIKIKLSGRRPPFGGRPNAK